MAPGFSVSDPCKTTCTLIQGGEKYRYAVLVVKDGSVFEVESKGDRKTTYESFLKDLRKGGPGSCRYALYDFEQVGSKGRMCCLISWMPEKAALQDKLMHSAYFIALKTCLGIEECVDAGTEEEIAKGFIEEQLLQMS